MNLRRVWVVYSKELTETLRDRRTLIAMVLVPLLLYPVLMLAVVQALQIEQARRQRELYRVAVPDDGVRHWLLAVLAADEAAFAATASAAADDDARPGPPTMQLHAAQFDVQASEEALEEVVRDGRVQLGISLDPPLPASGPANDANRVVRVVYDPAETRSEVAMRTIQRVIARQSQRIVLMRLADKGLSPDLLTPLRISEVSVASPSKLGGALLGQVLPFLLVLMTVTGAIYPAIDLTAGERERGTLETLMAAPAPRTQIMAGKFLVVMTVAILSSLLNLVSMGGTMRFSGIAEAMTRALPGAGPIAIPIEVLPIVMLAMVPFAVLFSAVMLAACSFARTFKEAQNYMTPVIIAAMVPAMVITYMPSVRLSGPIVVMPVANVIVMLRELFAGRYDLPAMALTFCSTCLYATAAVMVAARLYGQEAVLFADVGSYRTLLRRRLFRPEPRPAAGTAMLLTAVVFPLAFYWQTTLATPAMSAERLAGMTISLMLLCYLLPPLAVAWYFKLDFRETFSLRVPTGRSLVGGLIVAASAPVAAVIMSRWVMQAVPPSEEMQRLLAEQQERLTTLPTGLMLLTVALLPAVCEEALFRGFLQSGLRDRVRPVTLCVAVGVVFGLFHTDLWRIPTTSVLGIVLAIAVLRSGSLFVAMLIHFANNAGVLLSTQSATLARYLGTEDPHPPWALAVAAAGLLIGLLLMRQPEADSST